MVSLENRSVYLNQFGGNKKVYAFIDFIFLGKNSPGNLDESLLDVDTTFISIIDSIVKNDKSSFSVEYNKISQRLPNKHSPFVNDDYLLFVIAIGIIKFNESISWFESVIEVRKCVTDECFFITKTLQNLVKKNYNSLDNHFGIILLYQSILKEDLLTPSNKVILYKDITSLAFPSKKSDFLNIIELCSYDLLINEQLIGGDSKYQEFKLKLENFSKKTKLVSFVVYRLLFVLWVVTAYYFYLNCRFVEDLVSKMGSIFGFFGFGGGIFTLFYKQEQVLSFIQRQISVFFLGK